MESIKKYFPYIFCKYFGFWIACFFGIWSLVLGQDRSWDLANYHLYNGYSFLNNKLNIDYGVASSQTYFNPLLDTFYFYLNTNLNPKIFGFIMGFIHGLNFTLVYFICKHALKRNNVSNLKKNAFLLASACILTPNFLSVIGSSSNDNTSAIFILIPICIILMFWESLMKKSFISLCAIFFAGFISGIGTSLKLTNGPYALAISISLLLRKDIFLERIKIATIFALGSLVGFILIGGFWYLKIWNIFGNPFYPYFDNIFNGSNILTNGYENWGPRNFYEIILWPIIISIDTARMAGGKLHQILWPSILILLFISFLNKMNLRKQTKISFLFANSINNFLIYFVFFGFILWMKIFNCQRYLVCLELILPLVIFLLLLENFKFKKAQYIAKNILIFNAILVIFGGFGNYGHTSWTSPPFQAEIPYIDSPAVSNVFLNENEVAGWLVTLFPKDLAFIRFGSFKDDELKAMNMFLRRAGQNYTLFSAYYFWREDNVRKWNNILARFHLLDSYETCSKTQSFINLVNFKGQINFTKNNNKFCQLNIRDIDRKDTESENKILRKNAAITLEKYGFKLDEQSCQVYKGSIGTETHFYHWCKISH